MYLPLMKNQIYGIAKNITNYNHFLWKKTQFNHIKKNFHQFKFNEFNKQIIFNTSIMYYINKIYSTIFKYNVNKEIQSDSIDNINSIIFLDNVAKEIQSDSINKINNIIFEYNVINKIQSDNIIDIIIGENATKEIQSDNIIIGENAPIEIQSNNIIIGENATKEIQSDNIIIGENATKEIQSNNIIIRENATKEIQSDNKNNIFHLEYILILLLFIMYSLFLSDFI